ncbi:MAG TPA: hypothetical protein DCS42_09900 [Nitrospiraceae bacterium]|jgi:hypothetical protein|nr:MAG: hypothetical protein A2X57_06135 [Nitrospirae bacterium GWD2_57_8]HAS54405.1 hypothetical protein [Nitrospiraceae bacterium]
MTERTFRIILGVLLLIVLYSEQATLIYLYIGILVFEGITNWRMPIIISRLRYGKTYQELPAAAPGTYRFGFEAERVLRLVIAVLLAISFVLFHDVLWFFPWFIGFALTMAGITGICPMAIFMRKVGFRG